GRARDGGGHGRGAGLLAPYGRDVHDAAAALALHVFDGEPRAANGPVELELQVRIPIGVLDLQEWSAHGRAGIVHQDVDAAEMAGDGRKEALDIFRLGDVGRYAQHVAALAAQ